MLRRIRLAMSGKRLALSVEEMEVVDVRRDRSLRADLGLAIARRSRRENGSVITTYVDVARLSKVLHGLDGSCEDHTVTRAFPQMFGSDPKGY